MRKNYYKDPVGYKCMACKHTPQAPLFSLSSAFCAWLCLCHFGLHENQYYTTRPKAQVNALHAEAPHVKPHANGALILSLDIAWPDTLQGVFDVSALGINLSENLNAAECVTSAALVGAVQQQQ